MPPKSKYTRFVFSPPEACPNCGRKFPDGVKRLGTSPPKEGTVVLCPGCLWVLAFGRGMRLHVATLPELAAIPNQTRDSLLKRIAKLEREKLAAS